ncbi:MAG: hypothetical protein ABFS14_12695 [Gemmatimonadota bacterium]
MIETISLIATFLILISLRPTESQVRKDRTDKHVNPVGGHRFIR